MKIYTDVDLRFNEIKNARIQRDQPNGAKAGTIYYNEGDNVIMYYTGSEWIPIGGGGDPTPGSSGIEQVHISVGNNITSGRNLTVNSNKQVKLNFNTDGVGGLILKDANSSNTIGRLSLGNSGLLAKDFIGVGKLPHGSDSYRIKHEFKTELLMVQVLDSYFKTVICDVTRYEENDSHYIKIEFSKITEQDFWVIVIGNPDYLQLEN
jgi:hypothetical protein